jgi:hypothetical protein
MKCTKYGSESSYVLQSPLWSLTCNGILPFQTFWRSLLVTSRDDIGRVPRREMQGDASGGLD